MIRGISIPPAPQGPDADKLARELEKALEEALSGAQVGREAADQARAEARRAIEEARAVLQERGGSGFAYSSVSPQDMLPPEVVPMTYALFGMIAFIVVGFPIARAIARRMDRRGEAGAAAASEVTPRLDRIEHAVDAIAIEIERISENQRYASRMMNEMRGLPQPDAASAWPAGNRAAEPVPREAGRRT